MTTTIPTVQFDTNDLAADKRFDVWRSAVHAHRAWLPEGEDPMQFTAVVDAWTLGEVVLAVSRLPAICLARTLEMASRDGEDWISLAFQLSGTTVFTLDHGDVVRTVGAGEIIVFDMTRDFKSNTSVHEVMTCGISRRPSCKRHQKSRPIMVCSSMGAGDGCSRTICYPWCASFQRCPRRMRRA